MLFCFFLSCWFFFVFVGFLVVFCFWIVFLWMPSSFLLFFRLFFVNVLRSLFFVHWFFMNVIRFLWRLILCLWMSLGFSFVFSLLFVNILKLFVVLIVFVYACPYVCFLWMSFVILVASLGFLWMSLGFLFFDWFSLNVLRFLVFFIFVCDYCCLCCHPSGIESRVSLP